jgi:hypothetical protein
MDDKSSTLARPTQAFSLLVVVWTGVIVYGLISSDDDEIDVVENLRHRYVDSDLTLDEFEDRVEFRLDGRAQETRKLLERIDGIGPNTSTTISVSTARSTNSATPPATISKPSTVSARLCPERFTAGVKMRE